MKNNFLSFSTNDDKFTGDISIKPFFLSSYLKFNQIDLAKVFQDNSIFINVLKSEILNNKNLNGKISVETNKLKGLNFLDEVKFNILLNEGDIFIEDLTTTFKDSIKINLEDTELIIDDNKLKFLGYITLDLLDANNFYAHYQISRSDRKNIKKITFGFLFNLEDKFIEINSLRVDENTNKNLKQFLNNFNSKKENILNKIIRRNLVKNFFKNL